MKNTQVTVATFVGCVKEKCGIGGSISLRGIYQIPNPDGTKALYERHTSQIRGMGWNPTTQQPTHGRVWGWIGTNGHHAAVGTHVHQYDGPETVEVTWRPRHEVAAETAAICLVGRAHIPNKQIRDREEPACSVEDAMAGYTPEKYPGWSLDADTGHGTATPCPDLSSQVAVETARINAEFDRILNDAVLKRAEWREGERVDYRLLKETDDETIRVTVGFNCGVTPDYYIPEGWKLSEESRQRLAEMRADKARREAEGKEIQRRFLMGWEVLRSRYQIALEQLGLTIGEDNHSLQNEFRISAKSADAVHHLSCPAGGKDGPHYHTSYAQAADWLDANAATYDVVGTAAHLAEKIAKAASLVTA